MLSYQCLQIFKIIKICARCFISHPILNQIEAVIPSLVRIAKWHDRAKCREAVQENSPSYRASHKNSLIMWISKHYFKDAEIIENYGRSGNSSVSKTAEMVKGVKDDRNPPRVSASGNEWLGCGVDKLHRCRHLVVLAPVPKKPALVHLLSAKQQISIKYDGLNWQILILTNTGQNYLIDASFDTAAFWINNVATGISFLRAVLKKVWLSLIKTEDISLYFNDGTCTMITLAVWLDQMKTISSAKIPNAKIFVNVRWNGTKCEIHSLTRGTYLKENRATQDQSWNFTEYLNVIPPNGLHTGGHSNGHIILPNRARKLWFMVVDLVLTHVIGNPVVAAVDDYPMRSIVAKDKYSKKLNHYKFFFTTNFSQLLFDQTGEELLTMWLGFVNSLHSQISRDRKRHFYKNRVNRFWQFAERFYYFILYFWHNVYTRIV